MSSSKGFGKEQSRRFLVFVPEKEEFLAKLLREDKYMILMEWCKHPSSAFQFKSTKLAKRTAQSIKLAKPETEILVVELLDLGDKYQVKPIGKVTLNE